ncbi:MAG TPA: hypothetical protein VM095_14380 [Pyrinomonadaceae bacterium]|nr:hypothetical protein [Pyrinomonadaceae bacterium]
MALYTRLWAKSKFTPDAFAQQPVSALTVQAALEIIKTTCTPTRTEMKLAYSIWERQVQGNNIADRSHTNHQLSL